MTGVDQACSACSFVPSTSFSLWTFWRRRLEVLCALSKVAAQSQSVRRWHFGLGSDRRDRRRRRRRRWRWRLSRASPGRHHGRRRRRRSQSRQVILRNQNTTPSMERREEGDGRGRVELGAQEVAGRDCPMVAFPRMLFQFGTHKGLTKPPRFAFGRSKGTL